MNLFKFVKQVSESLHDEMSEFQQNFIHSIDVVSTSPGKISSAPYTKYAEKLLNKFKQIKINYGFQVGDDKILRSYVDDHYMELKIDWYELTPIISVGCFVNDHTKKGRLYNFLYHLELDPRISQCKFQFSRNAPLFGYANYNEDFVGEITKVVNNFGYQRKIIMNYHDIQDDDILMLILQEEHSVDFDILNSSFKDLIK